MKPSHKGFTLVELLVVIAIIGILVALLLPAIQSAREAARRAQCVNNLKQLGIAMQNYHDVHKALPMGNYSCCFGTWQMSVLPFIEEQQLADMYQFNPTNTDLFDWNKYTYYDLVPTASPPIRNREVVMKRITTLTCPSDEAQKITASASGDNQLTEGATYHNYVANYGNTNHVGSSCAAPSCTKYAGSPFIGDDSTPHPNVMVTFRKITDGLSKTMMFSETVQGRENDLRGFTWWGWSAGFESFAVPNGSDLDYLQQLKYCVFNKDAPGSSLNPPCDTAVGGVTRAAARSQHKGGVNVAMCDASVQFVVNDVDLATWRAASTTKGEEVYSGLVQ